MNVWSMTRTSILLVDDDRELDQMLTEYLAAEPFRLNSEQLGSIFFVYLLGVVITPQSGRFLDYFGFRHTSVLYCSMMIAGLAFTLVKSLPIVIVGLAIFSSGVFVAQAAARKKLVRRVFFMCRIYCFLSCRSCYISGDRAL